MNKRSNAHNYNDEVSGFKVISIGTYANVDINSGSTVRPSGVLASPQTGRGGMERKSPLTDEVMLTSMKLQAERISASAESRYLYGR